MILELDRESRIPLYIQIVTQVRDMISRGALKIGDRLPANRELAELLGVNRTTVSNAYSELEADGLIASHVGRGTFVSAVPEKREAAAPAPVSPIVWDSMLADQKGDIWLSRLLHSQQIKDTISFAYGLPRAELFPVDEFRRAVDRALRRDGMNLLQLGISSGYEPLRETLSSQLAASGIKAKPEEILITNGCQQSLDLIRRVFVGPGDEVVLENPTYPGALSVFCSSNASNFISVPMNERGMDLDVLEDLLSRRRPKLICTVPTYQNPTGATMDMAARQRLLGLAVKHRVAIVEDDIYSELRYDGPMLPSLKAMDEHGVVISINSFSKVGFPGLRVGWVVAPRAVVAHLNVAKQHCDLHAGLLTQAAVYEFSRHGLLQKHIKRARRAYSIQRDAMLKAMEKHFPSEAKWTRPSGGMAIWVTLPQGLNADEILVHSAENGVIFSPGSHFYSSSPQLNMMRLCFTMASQTLIEEGIRRLGAVIKARMTTRKKQRAHRKAEGYRALV
jgi:DNA-binding transcriptional MocR family regulator